MKTYKVSFDLSGAITHIGADVAGIGVEKVTEWVHSDTVFSAIIHSYAKKFGFKQTNEFVKSFNQGESPFRCSSAFLSKDGLLFVPRPRKPLPEGFDWSDLFKVRFISLENLKKWLGITAVNWDNAISETFVTSINDDEKVYRESLINRVRPVNAKDRLHNQTQVFHRGETIYTPGTELYFFLDVTEAAQPKLKAAIDFLTEFAGLGGEINIGFSKMNSVSWQPYSLPETTAKNGVYLMSLYHIDPKIDWQCAGYDIINRKSWFSSPFTGIQMKKKAVKMVAEGSCLPALPSNGKLIDVTPDAWAAEKSRENWHEIYRYAYAYYLRY